VDKGIFKRVGDCPTPWPCFVIAANNSFLQANEGLVKHILEVINTYTVEFKQIPSIDRTLANRYEQQLEDIQQWLSKTHWGQEQLSDKTVNEVQARLHNLNLIAEVQDASHFLWR
jgi:hypothetical protein